MIIMEKRKSRAGEGDWEYRGRERSKKNAALLILMQRDLRKYLKEAVVTQSADDGKIPESSNT